MCAAPVACIAFLRTAECLFWSKSRPPSLEQPVEISVHAYVEHLPDRATFASNVAGARLPSVPIPLRGDPVSAVQLDTAMHSTGCVARLVAVSGLELYVALIPGSVLRVGRKRVWHFRDELAAALPARIRDTFARGRSGVLPFDTVP